MKRLLFLFLTIFFISCSGSDSSDDGGNNSDTPQVKAPGNVILKSPKNAPEGSTGKKVNSI